MKFPVFLIMLVCSFRLHAQELPKVELGVLGCEDGSRWYGFSFTAQAGCAYELQSSTDLQTWTTEESFMGWGESHPVLMKAMPQAPAAPSLPAGAIPTPRPRLPVVRLLMRPATGGGLVLSWLSLDDGTPRNWCFPNFTLSVGWQVVPGYIRRFTSHEFLISSPQLAQAPPAVNPALGVRDAAMIAEFETRFPAMQAEVAALLERMVAQPFAATMPAERKFYRLVVESEVDTDGDGTPDRLEFQQLFQRAAGNFSIGGPAPDPFNGDTDGNGLADGGERSSDGDGTSDSEDAAPEDERVDWRKLPPYRYALFPLPEGALLEGDLKGTPLQTCDFGNVLYSYRNQLFVGGVLKTLPEPTEMNRSEAGIYSYGLNMKAVALDDTGSAYAVGQILIQAGGEPRPVDCLISWTPTGEHPGWLREGDGCLRGIGSYESYGTAPDLFMPTRIGGAQQERMFLGFIDRLVPYTTAGSSETYYGYHSDEGALWTVSGVKGAGAVVKTSSARPPHPAHTVAPDGTPMGYTGDSDSFVGDHDFQSHVPRVVRLPSNELMAIKASGPPMIRKNDEWREAKSFKETVVDVSADTGFVFHKFDGKAWQNGKVLMSEEWAPGLGKKDRLEVLDAAPAGPILGKYSKFFSSEGTKFVLGQPVYVEGVDATVTPPLKDLDAGVDSTSLQAIAGSAKQNEMWIMAPTGDSPPTNVHFHSTATGINYMKMECPTADFPLQNLLVGGRQRITVAGIGTETVESDLKLKLASRVDAVVTPVKIKTMKRRTVKIALHKVLGLDEHNLQTVPIFFPEKSALEAHLNEIYGKQANTFFEVTVYEEKGDQQTVDGVEGIDFDFKGGENDLKLNASSTDPELITATPNAKADGNQPRAHIDVWVIGGGVGLWLEETRVLGIQYPTEGVGKALIDGTLFNRSETDEEKSKMVLHAIAHEIGHVMIGRGHADHADSKACLFWSPKHPEQDLMGGKWRNTDARDRRRLMCSGDGIQWDKPGHQLIKKEWDLIEIWLRNEESKGKLPLSP